MMAGRKLVLDLTLTIASLSALIVGTAVAQVPEVEYPLVLRSMFPTLPEVRPFQIISLDPAFDELVTPGTQLETVAILPVIKGEGAMWRDGEIWVTDILGGDYAVSPEGSWREVISADAWPIEPRNRWAQGPNGQVPWKDGAVLIARQGPRDIGMLTPDGELSSFVGAWDGKTLNSPNDLVVAPDGALWFTDPPFSVPGFAAPRFDGLPMDKPIPFNGVFRVQDGEITPMITDMGAPNGIAFSPDGKTLYISGGTRKFSPFELRAYDVGPDGALSNKRVLADFGTEEPFGRGPPDGMKVDVVGNIWLIGSGGILVYNSSGKLLGRLQLPILGTNLTFGDADYQSIYITTAGNALYRLRTGVKGLVPMYTLP